MPVPEKKTKTTQKTNGTNVILSPVLGRCIAPPQKKDMDFCQILESKLGRIVPKRKGVKD